MESKNMRSTIMEINMDSLIYNIQNIKNNIHKHTRLLAIIKAEGYGHGAVSMGKLFLENGADFLGVSILSEAIELKKAKIHAPIMILNYTPKNQLEDVVQYQLIQTIFSLDDGIQLSEKALMMGEKVKIHIKVDTGMGRLGFLLNQAAIRDIKKILVLPNLIVEGIFTHFPCADEEDKTSTRMAFERFCQFTDELERQNIWIPIKHVSNSSAILDFPEYNLDMVRAGTILYGHYPSPFVNRDVIDIKAAVRLKSVISHIKQVPEGTGISYGHTFKTKRVSTIATVPIGYADGYPRDLSNVGEVLIKGKRAKIVGLICMDQMMIDVTDIDDVHVDDEVIIIDDGSGEGPKVEDISKLLDTNDDDIICRIKRRVLRVYKKDGKIDHIMDYL